jgi:Undecaprenyl-phosphate galactose phosphotransferase WbaP
LALTDSFCLALAVGVSMAARAKLFGMWGAGEPIFAVIVIWCTGAAAGGLLPSWRLGPVQELRRVVLIVVLSFVSLAVLFFVLKVGAEISRLSFAIALGLSVILVPLGRLVVRRALIASGMWGQRTVVYGLNDSAELLAAELRAEPGYGYVPTAVVQVQAGSPNEQVADRAGADAQVAVLVTHGMRPTDIGHLLEGVLKRYQRVTLVPELEGIPTLWVRATDLGGRLGLEITRNLERSGAKLFKRSFDLIAVVLTLPIWIPICGAIAAVVWLYDRETPFFGQERIGVQGKSFVTIKLRTMVVGAEALADVTEFKEEWSRTHKLVRDPRITPIGRLLRRTSLDELPQLWNVLVGDMSLVGPRPLPLYHHRALPEAIQKLRTTVRPGLTGLWQVSGRSSANTHEMGRLDSYYVRNWSMWLDIVLLVRTVRAVVRGDGAY